LQNSPRGVACDWTRERVLRAYTLEASMIPHLTDSGAPLQEPRTKSFGSEALAAGGLVDFLCVDEQDLNEKLGRGVQAICDEVSGDAMWNLIRL